MSQNESALAATLDTVGLGSLVGADDTSSERQACTCHHEFEENVLIVDADGCDGNGDLAAARACRGTVIESLEDRDVEGLVVRSNGLEYRYGEAALSLLAAAGRFIDMIGDRNDRLAGSAKTDPLTVADELRTRTDPVADIGSSSGLLSESRPIDSYGEALTPTVGLTIGHSFVDRSVGGGARLRDVTVLETGSEARIYDRPDSVPCYALDPVETAFSIPERTVLVAGYEAIADGSVDGDRAASRAIEHVTEETVDPRLATVLSKHTAGYDVLEDLFADPRISDVYATAPVLENPLRIVCDGESMATNVHLTDDGARSLASRIRRTSGRAFSRANPTVDATVDLANGTGIRIAGVSDPVSDGVAFAFRERADDQFTLPGLVANRTMTAEAAAFLSVAIERSAAALIAGTRGAGKTTLLGTLLYELTPDTRTVVIEDTPELPVSPLQGVDRDVQALRTGSTDGPEITPAEALRTALRLGDGALVVGEIRGEEARVLYEAMRVGANANAVLGTIHGDGADDVYERVVSDLQVEPSSFGATDLVVTTQSSHTPSGKKRRLARIEEVLGSGEDIWFEPLYEISGDQATSTGRIDRGESHLVDRLTGPSEAYADIRSAIDNRTRVMESLAADGRTSPREVASAYAQHRLE